MSPGKPGQTCPTSSPTTADYEPQDQRLQRASQALDVTFYDPALLQLALIHTSYLNEQEERGEARFEQANERLEFLGDAVLGLLVADYLYRKYPEMTEGELTVARIALVRRETLARWATDLELDELLYIARGERQGGRISDRVLAGAFEAVLGAIYLDRGLGRVREFLESLLDRDAGEVLSKRDLTNYKGQLQEIIQEHDPELPEYVTVSESGPAHDRHFVVQAIHHDSVIGEGTGRSKRAAEQAAARDALMRKADAKQEQDESGETEAGATAAGTSSIR